MRLEPRRVDDPWPLTAMTESTPDEHIEKNRDPNDLSLSGRKILVVEDESLIALLIMDALEDAGATVIGPCYTLAECLKTAKKEQFDAAVLDVDLAGQDVFPAADELMKRGVPFVFHTGHADRTEIRARFGDVRVCRKPTPMGGLVALLTQIAAGRQSS